MKMKFEIIKNSESHTGYNIPDCEYRGVFPGYVCGWQFEFRNKDGKIDYNSVSYFEGTAEEYCDTWLCYGEDALFEMERFNGFEPTGRVIFRGYGISHWDAEERDWYVTDAVPEELRRETEKAHKVWTVEEIRELLKTNDKMLMRSLKKLYDCQTADETASQSTSHANGAGFNKPDAQFMTNVAEFMLNRGYLTDRQKAAVRKRIMKYAGQLTRIANAV